MGRRFRWAGFVGCVGWVGACAYWVAFLPHPFIAPARPGWGAWILPVAAVLVIGVLSLPAVLLAIKLKPWSARWNWRE
jgi:hypothetical protein